MQKEIPILFSTPMVQAIMDGRKTITRRILKHQSDANCLVAGHDWEQKELLARCPYGTPGNILWVRETWCDYNDGYSEENKHLRSPEPWILYKADCKEFETAKIWRPSIFMPKTICRIWLQVTKVRAERLHDITEADAVAEGIDTKNISGDWEHTPVQEFEKLWQKINGTESWEANPWVWVIEFKALSTTGKPSIIHNSKFKI